MRVVSLLLLLVLGCATHRGTPASFRFGTDTFAFENETVWEYVPDADTGRLTLRRHEPWPAFALRCGNMARAARQFRLHARFAPERSRADEAAYRELVGRVMARDPRAQHLSADPIVIPGYADLRAFSQDHETLVKAALDSPWKSYYQRGNWRMIFPFTERQQEGVADALGTALARGELPIVHVVRYPRITINHMLLVYAVEETPAEIRFVGYDPNDPRAPLVMVFDRSARTFVYPRTIYFPGGPVKAYEIYRGWLT